MRPRRSLSAALLTSIHVLSTNALELNINSISSISNTAATLIQSLLDEYYGNRVGQPVGIFNPEDGAFTWGQSGAAWSTLIDYWNRTDDTGYNVDIQQALLAQLGPNYDYMTPNQTKTEGNDDQGMWALAAMTAAEQQFPNLPSSPSWLNIAQNVFELQVARWDNATCGGGLRWQIFTFNKGYEYKSAISTGIFFQLAARLARFTGEQRYADWATRSYDWTKSIGLINSDFYVFDGTQISGQDCTSVNKLQWTYNSATFLYGSAIMYDVTNGNTQWQDRTQGLLSGMSIFTYESPNSTATNTSEAPGALYEVACEQQGTCNTYSYGLKGLAAQWMGATVQYAPFTAATIKPILRRSALGAAAACVESSNGTSCGSQWTTGSSDNNTGFQQQLSALNVVVANLAVDAKAPATANTTNAGTKANSTTNNGTTRGSGPSPAPSNSGGSPGESPWVALGSAVSIIGALTLISLL